MAEESFNFISDPAAITEATIAVDGWLDMLEADADLRARVQIALAEILNNIAEHAYQERGDGLIKLDLNYFDATLKAKIVDQGVKLPKLPDKTMADPRAMALEDLPEGGFGWPLIRMLCDEISYERVSNSNHLHVVIQGELGD